VVLRHGLSRHLEEARRILEGGGAAGGDENAC
jgi:hypothetical protein